MKHSPTDARTLLKHPSTHSHAQGALLLSLVSPRGESLDCTIKYRGDSETLFFSPRHSQTSRLTDMTAYSLQLSEKSKASAQNVHGPRRLLAFSSKTCTSAEFLSH